VAQAFRQLRTVGCENRAGCRHAASIGEESVENPFKRPPHRGGYQHITAEEWGRVRPGDGGMASSEKAGAMTTSPVYQASPIRRTRATKAEVETRREALLDIIEAGRPMTVRQVFYQATVRGLVEKAESGYGKVQIDLTVMRRAGELPYDWLADNTRWQRKPRTFDSVEDALKETARLSQEPLDRRRRLR
jgi:hypothetical protein